jgi:tRNA (pseudouridine54-N1)-methyltransferase
LNFQSVKRKFFLVANIARTSEFSLNDLPGAGRMDIVCRFIAQSLFISHGVRRDSAAIVTLLGEPEPPKTVLIKGDEVKYMSPDERNIAGLLKKSLRLKVEKSWKKSSPGIYISSKDVEEVLDCFQSSKIVYLREDGQDLVKNISIDDFLFVLGDHIGVPDELEQIIISKSDMVASLSPISLQADQCIIILHNILDRIERGWSCG